MKARQLIKMLPRPEWEALPEEDKIWLHDLSNEMRLLLGRKDVQGALDHMAEAGLTLEQKLLLWSRFDSKERARMKRRK